MTYEEWLDEMGSAHEREVEESIAQHDHDLDRQLEDDGRRSC